MYFVVKQLQSHVHQLNIKQIFLKCQPLYNFITSWVIIIIIIIIVITGFI